MSLGFRVFFRMGRVWGFGFSEAKRVSDIGSRVLGGRGFGTDGLGVSLNRGTLI